VPIPVKKKNNRGRGGGSKKLRAAKEEVHVPEWENTQKGDHRRKGTKEEEGEGNHPENTRYGRKPGKEEKKGGEREMDGWGGEKTRTLGTGVITGV